MLDAWSAVSQAMRMSDCLSRCPSAEARKGHKRYSMRSKSQALRHGLTDSMPQLDSKGMLTDEVAGVILSCAFAEGQMQEG